MRKPTLFTPRKLMLLVALLFFALSLNTFNLPSESERLAVVTGVAVELIDDTYYTGIQVLAPTKSDQQAEKIFLAKGTTVSDSMTNLSLQLGRELAFAHCGILAIGENLSHTNITAHIDYFTLTKKIPSNALIVLFKGEVKDLLDSMVYLKSDLSLQMNTVLNYNAQDMKASNLTIEEFYSTYYGEVGVSILPILELRKGAPYSGIEINKTTTSSEQDSSLSSEGGGETSTTANAKTYLVNNGQTSVFVDGEYALTLTPAQVENLNIVRQEKYQGDILVRHITDHVYTDADIEFYIRTKSTNVQTSFVDGKPHLKISVNLESQVQEVIEAKTNKKLSNYYTSFMTDTAEKALITETKRKISSVFDLMCDTGIDIISVGAEFYKHHYKKWTAYLDTLSDPHGYVHDITYEINISVNNILF